MSVRDPAGVRPTHPRVSVLTPVHNAGPFLVQTARSVLAQTFQDFEFIVIDDGSTDGCTAPVADFDDPRVAIISQASAGAPQALNIALQRARGEIVAFLDQDDLWLPNKLERHLQTFATLPDTGLTFDWSQMIDARGERVGPSSPRTYGTVSFDSLVQDFVIGNTSALVVRREVLDQAGPFNPRLPRMYDIDLCWRVAALRPDICRAVPEHLTLYRRHPGQMSFDWCALQQEWQTLLGLVQAYTPHDLAHVLPKADSNMTRFFAWVAAERRDFRAASRLLFSAVRKAPATAITDLRNWLLLAVIAGGMLLPLRIHRAALSLGGRLSL
ncbi:MAG: glycosyltransferase family 2 protein [Bryobacterales bacterium]|nr:glycosyltransferase family 2 protein [Bryobacterales bacterium]